MRILHQIAAWLSLAVALHGCGNSGAPADGGELADFVKDSPELADGIISDPLGFIVEYADQPDLTIEQVIILVLQSLRYPAIVPQQANIAPEDEGTVEYGDIFLIAQHYRQHGPDEDARRRIARLMDEVFPASEIFEQWTTLNPLAGSTMPTEPGVLQLIVRTANAQSSAADCGDAWSGVIPYGDAPETCFDVLSWTHRGSELRIFYPVTWNSSSSDYTYVERTRSAIDQSLDKFAGDLGLVNANVDVRMFTADLDSRTRADAHPQVYDVPCVIRSFPLGYWKEGSATEEYRARIAENYKQTVAHEMYHCFQGWNYRQPLFGPSLTAESTADETSAFHEARRWWVEGTAEFFGNVVYPCNQREFERVSGFDRDSQSVTLMELTYANVVFFMYMGRTNPASVIEMSRRMAVDGDFEQQYQAASAYGLGRTFHEFGRQYVDRNIADSCPGALMPVQPVVDIYDVHRGAERDFDLARFLLVRLDLQFLSGEYIMEYETAATNERQSAREIVAGDWAAPPAAVNAGCEVRNFRYVASYSQSDVVSDVLKIRETSGVDAGGGGSGSGERTSVIDACLVGNWRATDASMQEVGDWLAANPLTRKKTVTEKEEVTGAITGTFRRSGLVTGNLRDFTQKYEATMDMGSRSLTVGTTVIMNDTTGARYSAQNGVLKVWDACSQPTVRAVSELDGRVMSDMVIDMNEISRMDSIGGFGRPRLSEDGTIPPPGRESGPMQGEAFALQIPAEFEMRYSCSGGSLTVEHPDANYSGMPPWRFTKISDP